MESKITITQSQLTQLIALLSEIQTSLNGLGTLLAEITEEQGE